MATIFNACNSFFSSVPSSPPNFTLSPVLGSPNSLTSSWSVPISKNGIITAYNVYCNTSINQSSSEQVIGLNIPTIRSVVNGITLSVTFNTGLNPYTNYSCYVTANTSAGEGGPSVIATARTVEGSKFGLCVSLSLHNITGEYMRSILSCQNVSPTYVCFALCNAHY